LGHLLGIAQRTVDAVLPIFKQRFSPRKLIPVNVKNLGDHLHLQRIKNNLSQPEVARLLAVSTRIVRKWEHGAVCPNENHWQALNRIFAMNMKSVPKGNPTSE